MGETTKWMRIPRISRTIPFGYKEDPDDPDILLPVAFELEALEKAKQHVRSFSLREVANWLSEITGRYISNEGLRKRLASERTRQRRATSLKHWAERTKKIEEKIRQLEEDHIGAKITQTDDGDSA